MSPSWHEEHEVAVMSRLDDPGATGAQRASGPGQRLPGLPETMLAAVFHGPRDLRLEALPRPVAGPGEVVLRVHSCGVCGSDLRTYLRGPSHRYQVPGVLGHEFIGTVVELGRGVEAVPLGSRATAARAIPCGACMACRRGDENLCSELLDFGTNIAGAFAQYVRIPARSLAAGALVIVDDALPDAAAVLGEPIGCCLRGLRRGRVGPGSTVVVIGDGPIGLTHVVLAHDLGAARVICLGQNPSRLDAIARAGAETIAVDGGPDPVQLVRAALGGGLADTVVAATPDSRAVETAVELVRDGGTVVAFGGLAGDPSVTIDANRLHYGEWTLVGSFNCTTAEFREAIELAGRLDTSLFEASHYPLDEIVEAFEAAATRRTLKAVISMEPAPG
jgi:L-iditol 2-dehydrogenase